MGSSGHKDVCGSPITKISLAANRYLRTAAVCAAAGAPESWDTEHREGQDGESRVMGQSKGLDYCCSFSRLQQAGGNSRLLKVSSQVSQVWSSKPLITRSKGSRTHYTVWHTALIPPVTTKFTRTLTNKKAHTI